MTKTFNPIDYDFQWKNGWYEFDADVAAKMARRDRDLAASKIKAAGGHVRKWATRDQLMTRGGIGTPNPEIAVVVTVYGITYSS